MQACAVEYDRAENGQAGLLSWNGMPCGDVPYSAMPFSAIHCHALCHAVPCTVPCSAIHSAMQFSAMQCHAVPCHAVPREFHA
eukprot:187616-Chlamydomonas_euryale.AAC.1